MKYNLITLLSVLLLPCTGVRAQSQLTEHTLALDNPEQPGIASIGDFAWLAGRWIGSGLGGIVEETWNPVIGGTMIGTFRLITDDRPSFYEFLLLDPQDGTVTYRVKHFHPDLKGWEEKDDHKAFPLVRIDGDTIYFHGLTLQRTVEGCTHYLATRQRDGSFREARLDYRKE